MLEDGTLRQDFRFRGFPSQSMQNPRQPITATSTEDKRRNEQNFIKVFGRSSMFDPEAPRPARPPLSMENKTGNWTLRGPKHSTEDSQRGFQYGSEETYNTPKARGMDDRPPDKTTIDVGRLRQHQQEAAEEIRRYKQEKLMQDFRKDEERKRGEDNRRRKFTEFDSSAGENVVYKREPLKPPTYAKHRGHDLFLDTLGGPGGTVVRKDGGPGLQSMPDHRQGAYRSPGGGATDDLAVQQSKILEQQRKIDGLKRELETLKHSPRGLPDARGDNERYQPSDSAYQPSFGNRPSRTDLNLDEPSRKDEARSLDLENSRGGAGAPMRDEKGRAITRLPVTMVRDDYGTSKIQERIPGKLYNVPDEPVWDPFGKPGGGAPVLDRHGNRKTHVFGNFEKKTDTSEQARQVRAREVMLNDLRAGMEDAEKRKYQERQREKAQHADLADVIKAKEVGRPRVDPITGTLANQHLGNSDVSKLKMNYQPKDDSEKRHLHEFLKEQVEEQSRSKHLDKLRDIQESNKHFNQFDQRWGAFGGGAPKDRVIRKKVNLDNALYYYDRESRSEETYRSKEREPREPLFHGSKTVNPSYQKRFSEEDIRHQSPEVTPRYVKSTTKSTANNLYEYPMDKFSGAYQSSPPYATGSANY